MSTAILTDAEREAKPSSQDLPMETDEALYELINGQRVEMPPMSIRAVKVATRLSSLLNAFAELEGSRRGLHRDADPGAFGRRMTIEIAVRMSASSLQQI